MACNKKKKKKKNVLLSELGGADTGTIDSLFKRPLTLQTQLDIHICCNLRPQGSNFFLGLTTWKDTVPGQHISHTGLLY